MIKLYGYYRATDQNVWCSRCCVLVILRYKSQLFICAKDDRFKVNQLFKFLLRQWEFPWWLLTSSPTNLTNSLRIKLMVWTFQRLRYTLTGRHFVNFATNSTSICLHILICWNNITRKVSNPSSFCDFNKIAKENSNGFE